MTAGHGLSSGLSFAAAPTVAPMRPAALWDRLRSTYWFVPSLVTAGCIGLALALTWLDRSYTEIPAWMGWAYGGGADGARALLSAIAGSTMTVVSVTFSVMVVALTVSSQHFGPLLLSSFMRDSASQAVLGAFTGTFAYCLIVLRTVQGEGGDRYEVFVPHLAVSGGVLLTLVSVAMLIFYVHHIAISMQVSEITLRVVEDLERSIDRLYPDTLGAGEAAGDTLPPVPEGATLIRCTASGYIQDVDGAAMLRAATQAKTTIWVLARPGSFVVEHQALAAVAPVPVAPERFAPSIRGAFTLGADRTSRQDVAYAAQQLVEVALRALSPGVNEPFTATACIDRLTQGLARLARRRTPSPQRLDEDGQVRVIAEPRRLDELLTEVFEPIARHAETEPVVLDRLRQALGTLREIASRPEDHAAIDRLTVKVRPG
jgi:uncharacterized membrane protein